MFGSTVPMVFDELHQALHKIIRDEISTLPFPQCQKDESGDGSDKDDSNCNGKSNKKEENGRVKLTSILNKAYSRHIDLAEVYATNYLFTIYSSGKERREFSGSKKKQRRLVEAFLRRKKLSENFDGLENDNSTAKDRMDEKKHSSSGIDNKKPNTISSNVQSNTITCTESGIYKEEKIISMPQSVDDIPSREKMNALDEELKTQRAKLRSAHLYQTQLRQRLSSIHSINNSTELTRNAIDSHLNNDKLHKSVSAAMMGKDGLIELCSLGEEAMKRMDAEKVKQSNSNDSRLGETMEFSETMKAAALEANRRPRKKLTLEEDFEKRQKEGMCVTSRSGSLLLSNLSKKN